MGVIIKLLYIRCFPWSHHRCHITLLSLDLSYIYIFQASTQSPVGPCILCVQLLLLNPSPRDKGLVSRSPQDRRESDFVSSLFFFKCNLDGGCRETSRLHKDCCMGDCSYIAPNKGGREGAIVEFYNLHFGGSLF